MEQNVAVAKAAKLLSNFDFDSKDYDCCVELFYRYNAGGSYVSRVSTFEEHLSLWDNEQWNRFVGISGENFFSMRVICYPKDRKVLPVGIEVTNVPINDAPAYYDRLVYKDNEKHSREVWPFQCDTLSWTSPEAVYNFIKGIDESSSVRVKTDLALAQA